MLKTISAIVGLMFLGACAIAPTPRGVASPSSLVQEQATIAYVLLANFHLLMVNIDDGKVIADLVLGAPPASPVSSVHASALSADDSTLYVLFRDSAVARIAVVETTAKRVVRTIELGSGAPYHGLDLGRRSGLLYVFGNEGTSPVVWAVDPTDRNPIRRLVVRPSGGHSWFVYRGLVSADEDIAFISYHGADTTGIDRLSLTTGSLVPCPQAVAANLGCIASHGGMEFVGERLLVTTGEGPLLAVDPITAVRVGQYEVGLDGNHVMEFATDRTGGRAFVIGSCGYSRGLALVDLNRSTSKVIAPSRSPASPCGERLVVVDDGRLVTVQTARPVPSLTGQGKIVVLNETGVELRQVATEAEPLDLVIASVR